MITTITNEQISQIANRYINNYGGNVYEIPGTLNDNYIITAPGKKSYIIKEMYLNEWSSCNTVKRYNALPKKYAEVIYLLEAGDDEKAGRKFFA